MQQTLRFPVERARVCVDRPEGVADVQRDPLRVGLVRAQALVGVWVVQLEQGVVFEASGEVDRNSEARLAVIDADRRGALDCDLAVGAVEWFRGVEAFLGRRPERGGILLVVIVIILQQGFA